MKKKSIYNLLFEDKDVEDKDATESDVSITGKNATRQSKDSVDDQIDSLILRYENFSIDEKQDDLDKIMESISLRNLNFLLLEQEEENQPADPVDAEEGEEDASEEPVEPTGSEDMTVKSPAEKEEIPNLNIDKFSKRCARLIINHRNLLRIEEAIVNRVKNFLDEHYGDAFVSEFLSILENEYGITIDEFNDAGLNASQPDVPFAVGANASGAGGGG